MDNASYVALSRQTVLMRELDVIAGNLANENTPGYQAARTQFRQYLVPGADGASPTAFVVGAGTRRDVAQGPLLQTGNPLDLAINGAGYFTVQAPGGNPAYTRAGQFQLDVNRNIVTPNGYPVLSSSGQPIQLPEGTRAISVGSDGTVSANGEIIGRVAVVQFADEQQMTSLGHGLYATQQTPTPAANTTVAQGVLEQSNVQPIEELTRMMKVQRAFEAASELVSQEDQRSSNAIDKLGSVPS